MQSPKNTQSNQSSRSTQQRKKHVPDLDLTGTSCPMAFVKTRLYLDQKSNEATVDILYEDTKANEPLVRSIQALGHKIISTAKIPQNIHTLASTDSSSERKLQAIIISVQVEK